MPRKQSARKVRTRGASAASKVRSSAREVFSVRFSPQELLRLRTEAAARGATLAALVRDVVMSSIDREPGEVVILGSNSGPASYARISSNLPDQGETVAA